MAYIEGLIILVLVLLIIGLAIIIKPSFRRCPLQMKRTHQKPPANSSQTTISDACERILRDSDSDSFTLDDLHIELSKGGTICSKAALEFILLDEFLRFSVDHSCESNLYRLNSTYLDKNP
jgi:hypothetical protein